MIIKDLKEIEIPDIAQLEKLCFSNPWSEDSIKSSFNSPVNKFLAAFEDNKIVGYIGLSIAADEGYILNVAVAPDYRSRGIGKALVKNILDNFSELAFVTLEVRPSNTAAVNLYTSLGFKKVGERKNYYRNPTENALLLTKYNSDKE